MRTGKKKNNGKKTISHRTSFRSLTISKKSTCIKHTEIHIEKQWDTVYVSAKELKASRNEILQNMKSLRHILGDF